MEKKDIKCNVLDTNKLQPVKETEKAVCYRGVFAVLTRQMIADGSCANPEEWERNVWFPKVWIRDGVIESKYVLRKVKDQSREWGEKYGVVIAGVSWE